MKKVLFVMHTLGFGGAERSLVNLMYELPKDKYQVDILLFRKTGALIQQLPDWVNLLETPQDLDALYGSVGKAGKLAITKVMGTAISRLVRKTKKSRAAYRWKRFYCPKLSVLSGAYDAAVAYGGSELMYYVTDRVDAKRKLIWIHNDYRTGKYSAEDDRPYLQKADEIVSISQVCVDVLRDVFPEFQGKMHYIENITSENLLRKRAEEEVPPEFADHTCNLLSVGRLYEQKGFDMAVEAAAKMKAAGLSFRWFIIGDGHLRKPLENQIQQLGVSDCFVLLGTRSNPYPYMKFCTALVQPSRYEGKSVVLDEAKILGTPIIATAYPTVRDQITEGKEGYIVPMDPQGIADGIQKVLADAEALSAVKSHLLAHHYGNADEVTKYIALLDKTK